MQYINDLPTIAKGTLCELIAIEKLLLKNYHVSTTLLENRRYDIRFSEAKGDVSYRVQVKMIREQRYVPLVSSTRNAKKIKTASYCMTDVDFIAGVDINTCDVYLIPLNEIQDHCTSISIKDFKKYKLEYESKDKLSSTVKGYLAENKVQQVFIRYGFTVTVPLTADSVYDLIIDSKEMGLKKVQVKKMTQPIAKGSKPSAILPLYRKKFFYDGKRSELVRYTEEEIDYMCGVDLRKQKVYFIPIQDLKNHKTTISASKLEKYEI